MLLMLIICLYNRKDTKKNRLVVSIIQKSFVILHHHCTIGSKSAKHSLYQSIFKLFKKKQNEETI